MPPPAVPRLAEDRREWLESNGAGGFASGTVCGIRTRREHALLLTATRPPGGRVALVNGLDVWIETPHESIALSSQDYLPATRHPDGAERIERFIADPWPRWTYRLPDGTSIVHEVLIPHGRAAVGAAWRCELPQPPLVLCVRPLLSGREASALHRENTAFRVEADVAGDAVSWQPYASLPRVTARSNGAYTHEPVWYRHILYAGDRARGLAHTEDLASPGIFRWDLSAGEGVLLCEAGALPPDIRRSPARVWAGWRASEAQRRKRFTTPQEQAADAYLVRRGSGRTIVAGYPELLDCGRDTMIALRGMCLATSRWRMAADILREWTGMVVDGLLPDRVPAETAPPTDHAVDAPLWYIVAVDALRQAAEVAGGRLSRRDEARFTGAVEAILTAYAEGTRHGIRTETDGLLACGEPGTALTWMDARVDGRAVTPRIGKPVEVEALWLNALWIGSALSPRWQALLARGRDSFRSRFWHEALGGLHDVIDVDHTPGRVDSAIRPNQIFAVGGLPMALLEGERARRVADLVESRLWTPLGLRSLAPGEPGYTPRGETGISHQGAVWPWLTGPFVEAWVRVRGHTPRALREARQRFLAPLRETLNLGGLGHLPQLADAEPPHQFRGCPFQAWSLAEWLRLDRVVLAEASRPERPAPDAAGRSRAHATSGAL